MSVTQIKARGDFITLGQALKIGGLIDSGGQARGFLETVPVLVNGEQETRRGRKLVPGDRVVFPDSNEIAIS